MRLLLVADTYPPSCISGALQMRDLAVALARQGHRPLILTPTDQPGQRVRLEEHDGVQVLRVRAPRTKDVPYMRRTLAELVLPWVLLRGLNASVLRHERWDGVIWYSPTIFLGKVAKAIKRRSRCPGYLIVRDLFPDWAADAGVLKKGGLAYRCFKRVERFQYRQADMIGVQTPSNAPLVACDAPAARIEVLHNWLSPLTVPAGMQSTDPSSLLGDFESRINFVYAGNMGVAQDMGAFIALAKRMQGRADVGFIFIGRGSEVARLKVEAQALSNLLVLDEVSPERLSEVLAHCHVGIVALHPAHATHNIPGKLLTYLNAGLPVLARVNPNNDLVALVEREGVGLTVSGDNPALLHVHALRLADDSGLRAAMGQEGRALARRLFSPESAARQLTSRLMERAESDTGTRRAT
ncbi:glycosyltransferase family 4 protein [Thermomonas sp. HDW16]|uniref:glycosyltransferase family 4 protein n=1 Tax=Thermomonas sp. HDW16 TaxID=2714945 RepID=UPI00140B849C|nr:glycosyltransferase family 4 protein [Thermomonas sp. HDW16]QIL20519.1 glycosyltransferase family 4 protein [Thermomonas sp. HDW16]